MSDALESSRPESSGSKRNLLVGAAAALLAAAAIVFCFVLPAEFGVDPTGVGEVTGVLTISQAGENEYLAKGRRRSGVLTLSNAPLAPLPGARDRWRHEFQPYESIELKYEIDGGGVVNFAWSATGPLDYDVHAHPFDGGSALTESYNIGTAPSLSGAYVAPFTGIHGWHWQNRSLEPVQLTLDVSGDVISSRIFDARGEHARPLAPPQD